MRKLRKIGLLAQKKGFREDFIAEFHYLNGRYGEVRARLLLELQSKRTKVTGPE